MKVEMKKSESNVGTSTCSKSKEKSKPTLTFKGGGAVTCYKPRKKQ